MASDGKAASRNWLFTVNHVPVGYDSICERLIRSGKATYIVLGRELAPSTGHLHLQGFIQFRCVRRFRGVKKFLKDFNNPRLDMGDGKAYSMMMYCKKDGEFSEYGSPPLSNSERAHKGGKGQKTVWKKLIKLAELGDFATIKRKYAGYWFRYFRTIQMMHKDFGPRPEDLDEVTGVWIYGRSGAGKSHYAREFYPDYYDKPCNKWFDNYQGEPNVLLDDFDKNHHKLAHHLKRWADRYSFTAEIKGSQINMRPKRIVVTSQYRIEDIWDDEATREAVNRRFIKVKIHIDSQGNRIIQEQGF